MRLDIKRRDALTAPATTPLLGLITPGTPPRDHGDLPVPTALDLPDVTTEEVTPPAKPATPIRVDKRSPAPAPVTTDPDIADWL